MTLKYRSIWISDTHLGTKGCKAEQLRDFLDNVECDYLYLVGDIIDLWKFKSGFFCLVHHPLHDVAMQGRPIKAGFEFPQIDNIADQI